MRDTWEQRGMHVDPGKSQLDKVEGGTRALRQPLETGRQGARHLPAMYFVSYTPPGNQAPTRALYSSQLGGSSCEKRNRQQRGEPAGPDGTGAGHSAAGSCCAGVTGPPARAPAKLGCRHAAHLGKRVQAVSQVKRLRARTGRRAGELASGRCSAARCASCTPPCCSPPRHTFSPGCGPPSACRCPAWLPSPRQSLRLGRVYNWARWAALPSLASAPHAQVCRRKQHGHEAERCTHPPPRGWHRCACAAAPPPRRPPRRHPLASGAAAASRCHQTRAAVWRGDAECQAHVLRTKEQGVCCPSKQAPVAQAAGSWAPRKRPAGVSSWAPLPPRTST